MKMAELAQERKESVKVLKKEAKLRKKMTKMS